MKTSEIVKAIRLEFLNSLLPGKLYTKEEIDQLLCDATIRVSIKVIETILR